MKPLKLFFVCLLLAAITSCNGGKAKTAFKNGTVKIGDSYEQMVQAIGEPLKTSSSDDCMVVLYSTVLTGTQVFFLLEKGEDGKMYICDHAESNIDAIAFSQKVGKTGWD